MSEFERFGTAWDGFKIETVPGISRILNDKMMIINSNYCLGRLGRLGRQVCIRSVEYLKVLPNPQPRVIGGGAVLDNFRYF